jgi:hypothetical protein
MEDELPPALENPRQDKERSHDDEAMDDKAKAASKKKVVVDTSNIPENEPVKYGVMGSEDIPIDKNEESLYFTSLRIGEIKGLEGCSACKVSAADY